jgi:RNA polymerase sigma factor for flagellar operon FliA
MVDEEIELCRRWRDERDAEALSELLRRYTPSIRSLAYEIARRRRRPGMELEDIEQAGVCGLMTGLRSVDLNRKDKFRAYLKKCISTAIWSSDDYTGCVPRRQAEYWRRVLNSETELSQKLHREPTEEEVARRARLTLEQARDALAARNINNPDQPSEEVLDSSVDPNAENPEVTATKAIDNRKRLEPALRALASGAFTEEERELISLRVLEEMTFPEIAERLFSDTGKVKSKYYCALSKLRKYANGTDEE